MLEDILEGRKAPLGAYKFFADYIIECVAGKREWKKQRETITMASATSPTDEAFALLAPIGEQLRPLEGYGRIRRRNK
jgi:hypothetical protein